jgi:hypothetical protein
MTLSIGIQVGNPHLPAHLVLHQGLSAKLRCLAVEFQECGTTPKAIAFEL